MTAPQLGAGAVVAGKYSIRALLGHGGAVATYHAASTTGQDVALKVYDPAVGQHANIMQAMEQAYAAVNALPPNSTAPILDAGYDQATGVPFSVVELLRMPSIAQQNRRFTADEVVTLLQGMARSLDLVHLRKVVHGALKPSNVFTGPNLNPVLVIDFAANLAKGVAPTQEGYALMAPWIAPEQIQGGAIGPPADVFSAALIAFYALTGRSYWRSCQGQRPDLAAWQQEIAGPRTPASARAAELGAALSPTTDSALWKALAVDPNERYRSVSELASSLEDALKKDNQGNAATMALPAFDDAGGGRGARPAAGAPALGPDNGPPSSPPTMALPSAMSIPGSPGIPGMPQGMGPGGYGGPPNAATMALPSSAFEPPPGMAGPSGAGFAQMSSGPGGFPAAGMQGGYGAPGGPGGGPGGYGGQGGQAGYGGQGGPGMGAAQAYPSGRGPGDQYPPPPAVMSPAHAVPPQQGGAKKKVLAIVGGVVGVALIAAAVTVFVVHRGPEEPTGPVAIDGSATGTAAQATPPREPTPPPTAEPAADPPSTAEPTAAPSASAAPDEPAVPAVVPVTIVCKPACDAVRVDGKVVDIRQPIELKPGTHKIDATKVGYLARSETIEVKAGEPFEKVVELPPAPKNPTKPPAGPKCTPGQFIKKCK